MSDKKEFVRIFKKYKNTIKLSILESFLDKDNKISINDLYEILENQSNPRKLWDLHDDPIWRKKLIEGLINSLSSKRIEIYEDIESLHNLSKNNLSVFVDSNDDDSNDNDDNDDNDDSNDVNDKTLYHATARENLSSIQQNGLSSMSRRYIYFWEDENEAINVASRHGSLDLIIFRINKSKLEENGYKVFEKNFGYGPQWCVEGTILYEHLLH